MATPAYVNQIGSFFSAATTSTGTMTTTTYAVPVGETVFVTTKGQSNFGVSCTDSVGNVYTRVATTTTGPCATIFGCVVTVPIPIGATITATMNTTAVNNQYYAVVFRNVSLSGPVASAVSFTTTTHTTGAVTPEQVNGIVISMCTVSGAFYTTHRTTTAGFTQLPLTVASNQEWSQIAWKQVDSSSIVSTSVLWQESATNRNWASVICALNATSGEFFQLF